MIDRIDIKLGNTQDTGAENVSILKKAKGNRELALRKNDDNIA